MKTNSLLVGALLFSSFAFAAGGFLPPYNQGRNGPAPVKIPSPSVPPQKASVTSPEAVCNSGRQIVRLDEANVVVTSSDSKTQGEILVLTADQSSLQGENLVYAFNSSSGVAVVVDKTTGAREACTLSQ